MLQLKGIKKIYGSKKTEKVTALKGIDIEFRDCEFVSILGQSGCGKTTLLNIIGGLDKYTEGDLVINGKSTKDFSDRDWDSYRNHSVGFVFQSYNLIQHQSVLANVEVALTLAGISKKERRKRAIDALKRVGLGEKIHKKPSELSGGQMQRVAIARALIGNPDILLADEPTGALDSATSVQIMDLLKEIAKDRLVVMVTHNPELAEKYSTRIVKLLDGEIVGDSNPYKSSEEEVSKAKEKAKNFKRTGMNFSTALSLSFKNLLNKKGRTILTAFAGSIGIIGIALILSLSTGMKKYVDNLQTESLAGSPISIDAQTTDISSMMSAINSEVEDAKNANVADGKIQSKDDITAGANNSMIKRNNVPEFKKYLESHKEINDYVTNIQYSYGTELNVYDNNYSKINPNPLDVVMSENMYDYDATPTDYFYEIYNNDELINAQYDIVAGKLPEKYNEVVLITDSTRRVPDSTLYALNLKSRSEYKEVKSKLEKGKNISVDKVDYSYDDFLNKTFKVVAPSDFYAKENGRWVDKSDDMTHIKNIVDNGEEIKIVGIIKVKEGNNMAVGGVIGYKHELSERIIKKTNESEIVKEQLEHKEKDVLTGRSFDTGESIDNLSMEEIKKMLAEQMNMPAAQIEAFIGSTSEEELKAMIKSQGGAASSYEKTLKKIGYVDLEAPKSIAIYPKDFENKKKVEEYITKYNEEQKNAGKDENVITYTDFVKMLTNSMSTMINVITGVLIAFVAISLVVSSIMIAIITYISVLERTKEIGILRAIGASKKDVSRLFNAETFIEGFIAGGLGIIITIFLNSIINTIIEKSFNVKNIAALGIVPAILLIALSIGLTVFAGLIPSKSASKKDPVTALRTE